MKFLDPLVIRGALSLRAQAQNAIVYGFEGRFDDATFAVERDCRSGADYSSYRPRR